MSASQSGDGYVIECVQEMEKLNLDDYGFNVMRTYFGDETLWASFKAGFDDELEKGLKKAPAQCLAALDKLNEKILTRFTDDSDLADQTPAGVSQAFQIFCLDESDEEEEEEEEEDEDEDDDAPWSHEMGPGIIRSMCLMVDEGSMRSLGGPAPYVIAVDALLHTGVDFGYPGYFKVAIDALVPRFYAAVGKFELDQVAGSVDADGIWRGMKGSN